jgi:hypothetical protein
MSLGLGLALLVSFACFGKDDEKPIVVQPFSDASHFEARETSDVSYSGRESDSWRRTINFVTPDRWRFESVKNGEPYRTVVIIGEEAWELKDGSWSRLDYREAILLPGLFPALMRNRVQSASYKPVRAGGTFGGEQTTVKLSPQTLSVSAIRDRLDVPKEYAEFYDGAVSETEITIGNSTGRPYEVVTRISGPNIHVETKTVVDYEKSVAIEIP